MTIGTSSIEWRRAGFAVLLLAGVALPGAARAENLSQMLGLGARTHVAQNQDQTAAQLLVQLQQMQQQIRTLTGQVEGLQFQVTQLQTALQKQQQDNETRFQQLEGGAGGKNEAVTRSGGAKPAGVSPQSQNQTESVGAQSRLDASPPAEGVDMNATDGDVVSEDALGQSQDPLLGTNPAPGATGDLGSIDQQDVTALPDKPLDLTLGDKPQSNSDAEAQYNAGYDAVTRGDYPVAADQLKQFLALYPDDPHAPDAVNWLGEALLQQHNYDDAAQVLVDGFKKFQDSPRAADILLKLGIALVGADEVQAACKTFAETGRRYPNASPAFKKRLGAEMARAKCPA